MALHELNIGARAVSSDGQDVGQIAKLILHPESNEIEGFLLDPGLFGGHRIVEASFITETDEFGVTLSLAADEVPTLPAFAHEQLLRMPGNVTYAVSGIGLAETAGSGQQWMVHGSRGGGLPATGMPPFFGQAPMGVVHTLNVSNLSENVVLVSEGTDVVGSDGRKVGTVDEVMLDDENRVVGLLVRAGWLLKHDVELPMTMVESVTADQIRLNVHGEDAEIYSERRRR